MDLEEEDKYNKEDADSDSSSSDEFEEEIETTAGDGGSKITAADQYKAAMLEEENEVENVVETISKEQEQFDKMSLTMDLLEKFYFARCAYQDITPMFVDGAPFLIDGSSLLSCVMKDSNYNRNFGGQSLHFVYLCERIIQFLCKKGGICEVVFFNEKSAIWREIPHFSLTENILIKHLKNNTKVLVHEMESIYDSKFINYVYEVQPCFMIFDFNFIKNFKSLFQSEEKAKLAETMFKTYALFTLALGIYCLDITFVELRNNMLFTFISSSDSRVASLKSNLRNFGKFVAKKCGNNFVFSNNIAEIESEKLLKTTDIRKAVLVYVAKMLVEDDTLVDKEEFAKVFLVYSAFLDTFPLDCRCFKNKRKPTEYLNSSMNKVIKFIDHCLKSNQFDHYECSKVADLWQGNLFVEIFCTLKEMDGHFSLSGTLDQVYGEYLLELNNITGLKLDKYPISLGHSKGDEDEEQESSDQEVEPVPCLEESGKFIPIKNEVVTSFCSDVVQFSEQKPTDDITVTTENDSEHCSKNSFLKRFRWESILPMSDQFDRIKDDNKYDPNMPKKKADKRKAKYAHYMDIYGSNIEGKTIERKPIVCEPEDKSKKKPKAQKKEKHGKNAMKYIEENNLMKEKKLLDDESTKYNDFKKTYKTNSNTGKSYETNYALINHFLQLIKTDLYIGKILIRKVDTLYLLWEEACKKNVDKDNRDLTYLKELFLTIRELLNISKREKSILTEKDTMKLGKKLCQLGFRQIAEKCSLPLGEDKPSSDSKTAANESLVRFQMMHLGPELERKVEGEPDHRAIGFIPDKWQKELFDIVDKRQSALIVAPTSSGKTYASYYCMERVLRESNDGRIVYVAPTKALVNQVAATIYSRFKAKSMPAGMSVYGVFTRDYKVNALDCQILVTVPECLELLLMSPAFHSWTKKLRYAIFDEVHCLAGQSGGVTWERCLMMIPCPFLALSATIQNPRDFHTWMQNSENFKKEMDKEMGTKVYLIIHSERHNDLVKHIYGSDKKIHHIHPFAYLSNRVMHVHGGIPKHVSLAPSEMIEMYDAMISVSENDPDLEPLNPEIYFAQSNSGFIFRHEAKAYEIELKRVIENWFNNKRELFNKTIALFREPLLEHESNTKSISQFMNGIVEFIEVLRSKNMLPALVFSYRREYCEMLGYYLTEHYEVEESRCEKKKKPIKFVFEDDGGDRDDEKSSRKNKVKASSGKKEEHRRRHADVDFFPLGLTDCDVMFSLRAMIAISKKDLMFIETRLRWKGFNRKHPSVNMLRRGVGVHHGGVPTQLRNTVEMLFRMKFLNIVFATGTLALGIHMPCKTVVVLGDSPYLNTIEYHQISGRAGRRGFDKTGDVVFFGLESKKMQTLQTSKLPIMYGNFPLTVSTVYRFIHLYNRLTDKEKKNEEKEKRIVLNRILTVLNQSLLYQSQPEMQIQMKFFFLFSCQLLVALGLMDSNGKSHVLTEVITHLHYHEPGSLAFIYLCHSGVMAKLCHMAPGQPISVATCHTIVLLLCRLFTRLPLRKRWRIQEFKNSVVKLPELPPFILKGLEDYNKEVKTVFHDYLKGVAKYIVDKFGKDEKLPLSGKLFKGGCSTDDLIETAETDKPRLESVIARKSSRNLVCSAFAGLSGQTDDNLYNQDSLIGNIRHEVFSDYKCIPLVDLETPLNGYAYDFFNHGVLKSIITDNGLKAGQDYNLLIDFHVVLRNLALSMTELKMVERANEAVDLNSSVRATLNATSEIYKSMFDKAYDSGKEQQQNK